MKDRNFTDEEVIKALECCASYDCNGCPLYSPTINCVILLPQKALELVDRQRAENGKLNKEVDRLSQCVLYHDGIVSDLERDLFNAKAEAIKEFAREHREIMLAFCDDDDQISLKVCEYDANTNNLVKEMTNGGGLE